MRSFCRDLGEYVGGGAMMLELKRIRIGDYILDEAKKIGDIVVRDIRE